MDINMKRLSGALAVFSVAALCFGASAAMAAEEPTIYYSVDNSRWYELPVSEFTGSTSVAFRGGSKDAKVYIENGRQELNILEPTQFMYMYAEAPQGAQCNIYTTIDVNQSQEPWSSLVDGGVWAFNKESNYAKYPVRLTSGEVKGSESKNAAAIPLRLGRTDIYVVCSSDSGETVYKISAKGRWTAAANAAQISEMHSRFRVYSGDAAGYAILMNGASLANDNQTYLFTYSKWRRGNSPEEWGESALWTGANFSKWLEGSSYVMMPGSGLAGNYSTFNKPEDKFFDLTFPTSYSWSQDGKKISGSYGDGYIGEVVLLMANRADGASKYYTDPEWECVNAGITPMDGGGEFSPAGKPRNYNGYDDSKEGKYYGVAIQWDNKQSAREESPAVGGSLSGYKAIEELKYAYRRKFRAGETVSIYSPANFDGDDERYGLVVPVIKYYLPEETADIKDIDAKWFSEGDGIPAGGGVVVNVTTLLNNYTYGRKSTAVYALYDESGALSDVAAKTHEALTTSDEFIFPCAKGKAKFLNVLITNADGNVILNKKTQIDP